MLNYLVTKSVNDALKRYPNIARAVKLPASGLSDLEIVRVLHERPEEFLKLLNDHLLLSGEIGKRILRATDWFRFRQTVSEFFFLTHFRTVPNAQAAAHPQENKKHHDIDMTISDISAKVGLTPV